MDEELVNSELTRSLDSLLIGFRKIYEPDAEAETGKRVDDLRADFYELEI